ncbi:hypothetical protein L1887_28525 [Cichorium endivia]|nr:hypothetical protein L1887_28525 [Cichorium endivia]
MKKTSFSKFTNVQSDPIILDFDLYYSKPRITLNLPKKTNKIKLDQNAKKQATRIPENQFNVKYKRCSKYRSESRGIPDLVQYGADVTMHVDKAKQSEVNDDFQIPIPETIPQKRSNTEMPTNKDVPLKVRRV